MMGHKAGAEDTALVKAYLELPVLLDVLELNIKKMKASNFKLQRLFELQLRTIQNQIIKDQLSVRQKMRKRGIKIIEENRTSDSLSANFQCRGYVESFTLLWGKVKADSEVMLADYLNVDIRDIER